MTKKRLLSLAMAALLAVSALGGCGTKDGAEKTVTPAVTKPADDASATKAPDDPDKDTPGTPILPDVKAQHGDVRTDFNDNLDLSARPLTPNEVADDFSLKIEAEDAVLSGNAQIQNDEQYSGGAYVNGQTNDAGDTIDFNVTLENNGFYCFNFRSHSGDSGRTNYLYIDDVSSGNIVCNSDDVLVDSFVDNIYLTAGDHKITIVPYWGYTDFDYLEITKSKTVTDDTYNVTCALSNPNADEHTKMLYNFLCDIYGKYSLTGNYAERGRISLEYDEIAKATGSHFAVLGLDMGAYSPTSVANGSKGDAAKKAYDWYINGGGIVQMCWHWTTPEEYVKFGNGDYWWNSFYKEHTSIDLDKIMNGKDDEGYELLMRDIDTISYQFEALRDEGVPILWRPLHEASGGWFWWGNCSPESYIKLWKAMYDKMTNEHNLTNLIWVWNGQNPEWYPGDDTVDIVAYDIYAPEHVYTSYAGTFTEAAKTYSETKLIALSENGVVMDPDLCFADNARWLFWGTWADPFTLKDGLYLSDVYTETDMLKKAYESDLTLTLEELPDLKNYPITR